MKPGPRAPDIAWKDNWEASKQRFVNWWRHEGMLIGMYGDLNTGHCVHEAVAKPMRPSSLRECYCNAEYRAAENHYRLSCCAFPLDILPLATTNLGPGSLALLLGAEPDFAQDTVWYRAVLEANVDVEQLPPLRFDPENAWWRSTSEIVGRCADAARGKYLVACPDLIENLDVLASLRGAETLLLDMLERPEWVEQKVWEINNAWFAAYERIYELIKLADGSSSFGPFRIWGPGKVAKLQCDASALFSPSMFQHFVVPALTAQCDWLDHSLYHLDGTQALGHLDLLLAIEPLDAIEWTPQAGIEPGGNRRWHDLYRRILAAGKSVQVLDVEPQQVLPLLDAIGTKGVYLMVNCPGEREAEALREQVGRHFGMDYP